MTEENRPSNVDRCISDIVECPICNEELQDNRCLPCLHMFCLKCLESYRKGKPKGKLLPCPVCRRDFSVPKSISDLPRNFFIDKLLDAAKIKKQDVLPKFCEICSEDICKKRSTTNNALEETKVALAIRFCCDCQQFLCVSCERQHKKIKVTSLHKIIDSNSVTDSQDLRPRPTYCIAHNKEAEVYCKDCKMIICWQCKALSHSGHASLEFSSATKELAAEFEEYVKQMSNRLLITEDAILTLVQREKSYADETNAELDKIGREQRKLYRNLTENGDKLKKALSTSTTVHLEALKACRKQLEIDAADLNRRKVYIEQMIHLGNASDLCEYKNTLSLEKDNPEEERTCRIIAPPVTHLSDSDLQDLLTGKRTDIDMQYLDNGNMINDNKGYLQDDLTPTNESTESFEEQYSKRHLDNIDMINDSKNQLQDEPPPTGQLTGSSAENRRTNPSPTLPKPSTSFTAKTASIKLGLNPKPSVRTCHSKNEAVQIRPLQTPLRNPTMPSMATTNGNRSSADEETSSKACNTKLENRRTNPSPTLPKPSTSFTAKTASMKSGLNPKPSVRTCHSKNEAVQIRPLQTPLRNPTMPSMATTNGNRSSADEETSSKACNTKLENRRTNPSPTLPKPSTSFTAKTASMKSGLNPKPSVRTCHSKNEAVQIRPLQTPLRNPTMPSMATTNGNRSSADEETSSKACNTKLDEDSSDWSLMKTITLENDRTISGITVLDSMLYVVSQDSNSISVYSATEFQFLKHFAVDKLVNPSDIISCKFNKCLYICDWGKTTLIHRVKVSEEMAHFNWSTDKDFGCLSVTSEHTILLAGYVSNRLKEYTSNGELIRSIELENDFKPWHSIKLDCNNVHYVICQGDTSSKYHRVCLIDFHGEIKNSFGGVAGSDKEQLHGPYHMAVDKNGGILVNDCNNSRILLLSQDLKFIKEIITSSSSVLCRARRMFLDEDAGRLYVADNARTDSVTKDGKVLVFGNLKNSA